MPNTVEDGIIELTGWVNSDDESHQAVAVARGVPGVETVVNRLAIRNDEDLFDDAAQRYEDGDPALTEGHWEGQLVGTGRRRQGNSTEVDRHADPCRTGMIRTTIHALGDTKIDHFNYQLALVIRHH